MTTAELKYVVLFLCLIVTGSLGNFSLLWHPVCLSFSGYRFRSMNFILRHLTVANILVILSRGIPEVMAALGQEDFLSNVGCKLLFYVQMIGKNVSFNSTCLLSIFQAITITSRSSSWATLRVKALKYMRAFPTIFWLLNMVLNVRVPMLVSDKRNKTNTISAIDYQYCSAVNSSKDESFVFVALRLSHDIVCLKLMIWSSVLMVSTLYRHRQRMQRIHQHKVSSRSSPEARASQSILTLVCAFVSFYALSSVMNVWFSFYNKAAWWLVKTSALIHALFPTISPFILMTREPCLCGPGVRSKHTLDPIR